MPLGSNAPTGEQYVLTKLSRIMTLLQARLQQLGETSGTGAISCGVSKLR
jgi:hypothetical protein